MARTVSTSIDLPTRTAVARSEVMDTDGDGGASILATAINTAIEQLRGSGISDWDDTTNGIVDALSQTARYRMRAQGRSELNGEDLDVWLYVFLEQAALGSFVARVRDVASGQNTTYTYSVDINAWVQLGQITGVTDNAEYLDIELEITTLSNMNKSFVRGLAVAYARDLTVLEQVGSGLAAYATSGIVPLDVARYAGELPATSARQQDMHTALRALYEQRGGGQILSASRARDSLINSTGALEDAFTLPIEPPAMRGSATLTVKVHAYAVSTEPVDGNDGSIVLTTPSATTTQVIAKGSAAQWYTITVTVVPPREGAPRPVASFLQIQTSYVKITDASGYIMDGSYA